MIIIHKTTIGSEVYFITSWKVYCHQQRGQVIALSPLPSPISLQGQIVQIKRERRGVHTRWQPCPVENFKHPATVLAKLRWRQAT